MKNMNKSYIKNSTGENVDLFVQKKSETRLIDCQDAAPAQIILKNDYLILKKKEPKKFRCGFIRIRQKYKCFY